MIKIAETVRVAKLTSSYYVVVAVVIAISNKEPDTKLEITE